MSEYPRAGEIFEKRYEIIELLGEGGVGTVFKARQLDADRLIALKFLHKQLADDSNIKARFIREAKALNNLQHDHIVYVYHLGETETGVPYMVMEYIQGIPLRKLILESPLPLERAAAIATQVCSALSYMHSCGIIHRDLKPDNIVLLKGPDNSDFVKVIDFGMVRFELAPGEQKLTTTGTAVGTVEYMSPEACKGILPDARSDLYSLAVCLYEMLAGALPYTSMTAVEIMYKHVHSPVPQLQISVSNKLINELIRRGLAKNPDERFQSAAEMIRALQTLTGSEPDDDFPKSTGSRNKFEALLQWAGVLLALIAIAGGASYFALTKNRESKQAPSRVVLMKNEHKTAKELEYMLSRKDIGTAPKILTALKFLEDAKIDEDGDTLALALEALKQAETVPGERGKGLINHCNYKIGEIYNAMGQPKHAIKYLEQVCKVSPANLEDPGIGMSDYGTAKGFLASCYLALGRVDEAKSLARELASSSWQAGQEEALIVAMKTHDDATVQTLLTNLRGQKRATSLAEICRTAGRFDLAKSCLEKGKSSLINDEDHIEYGLEEIRILISQGKIAEAKKVMEKLYKDYDLFEFSWSKRQRSVVEIVSTLIRLGLLDEASKIAFYGYSDKTKLTVLKAHILTARGKFTEARQLLQGSSIKIKDPDGERIEAIDRLTVLEQQGRKGQNLMQMSELKF